jgi:hypothetical protein
VSLCLVLRSVPRTSVLGCKGKLIGGFRPTTDIACPRQLPLKSDDAALRSTRCRAHCFANSEISHADEQMLLGELLQNTNVKLFIFGSHICKRKYPTALTFVERDKSVMLIERRRRVIFGVHNQGKCRDLGS